MIKTKRLILRSWKEEDFEAFAKLNADERVMERLHMHHDLKDDFDRPTLPEGHPLRRHVLYRLAREEYYK